MRATDTRIFGPDLVCSDLVLIKIHYAVAQFHLGNAAVSLTAAPHDLVQESLKIGKSLEIGRVPRRRVFVRLASC